ncbi:MAG: hypothetical protein ACRDL0_22065, partial [Thermoleophilaceae bacterium]
MRRAMAGLLLALLVAAPSAAQEPEPERIAPAVSIAGLDVGGLTVREAAALLRAELARLEESGLL